MSETDDLQDILKDSTRLIRAGQAAEAATLLAAVPESERTELVAMLLGTAHFQAGNLGEAQNVFEWMTRRFPLEVDAWVNLGCVLSRQEEFRKAVDVLRRAVQRNKRCAEAWYNLGIAQKGLKSDTMAISAYKEALRLRPDFADAMMNLGRIYLERNSLQQAQKCFLDVLKIRPGYKRAEAHLEKVRSQQQQRRKTASPFGRLVDLEQLEKSTAGNPEQRRQVSAAVRQAERDLCREVSRGVRAVAREIATQLDPLLRDQLHGVERLLIDADARIRDNSAVQDLQTTTRKLRNGHETITAALARVRSHLAESEALK